MTADIVESWERFKNVLKLYKADSLLNPPISNEQIQGFEKQFGFELPSMLKLLLGLNNGQQFDTEGTKKGFFKSVSGWDIYERHIFLNLEGISEAYESFIYDKVLLDEFGRNEIPFSIAVCPVPFRQTQYKEAFCINSSTGKISLIWTQHIDPMTPPEWQVERFNRADTLVEFIEKQIEQYR